MGFFLIGGHGREFKEDIQQNQNIMGCEIPIVWMHKNSLHIFTRRKEGPYSKMYTLWLCMAITVLG